MLTENFSRTEMIVINVKGKIKWLIFVEYLKQFLAHNML